MSERKERVIQFKATVEMERQVNEEAQRLGLTKSDFLRFVITHWLTRTESERGEGQSEQRDT